MVGLTGGIGAGKSTVAAMLATRGAVVIDADAIARQVVQPGSPVVAALAERFGADLVAPDGTLDRKALAARAFADDESRKALEAITHPAIGEEFLRQVADAPKGAIVVHDVPLLAETDRADGYAGVIVVEAPREERLRRLEARGIPRADAEARMAAQASDADRRAVATWVIVNDGDLGALEGEVQRVWDALVAMAQERGEG
jgi:dephospho-CoA kinase